MFEFLLYTILILFFLFYAYFFMKTLEYIYCAFVRKQPPFVPSRKKSRQAVVEQINTYYKNAKNVLEIGSGFGGLARYVAKHTDTNVIALENMPFSAGISKFLDFFSLSKKSKTIQIDAFKFLDNTDEKFDIALAYLGPKLTPLLTNYTNKINVLISLNFEIQGLKPVRVIDTKSGYVIYNRKKYPHKLFIYEF